MSTMLDSATVEIAGRNWLMAQLLTKGFEVAVPVVHRGVDVIVFREVGDLGIRALPLQLKCASAESFSLDRKYEGRGIPLVYIWNVLSEPIAYVLTYDEAKLVLGDQALGTVSWREGGKYAIKSVGRELRQRLQPFAHRWDWLESQLNSQPTSGSEIIAAPQ